MAKRSGTTRSVGSSGASATRTASAPVAVAMVSGGSVETRREAMTSEQRLANASVKLTSSDMKWVERPDDEANEDLGRNDLKRWDIPNIPYKDGERTRTTYATITQFLDRPGGRVAGYEIYFDKAGPVGEAKTLSEAKEKLLRYINSKRG